MSKFRKNKSKNKMEVCGKVPVAPVYAGVKELVSGLPYGVIQSSGELCGKTLDDYHKFANAEPGGRFFFSVTKEHEPSSRFLETGSTKGWIVSVGMLRHMVEAFIPRVLKSRYTDNHRGDSRKRENKSMDWVKPDFKSLTEYFRVLDLINFVKESPCDVVEASGNKNTFAEAKSRGFYGYRRRSRAKSPLDSLFISKRYEATNWYNTCRRCYYDDHSDETWIKVGNNYALLRREGMSYDTILSELAMTLT